MNAKDRAVLKGLILFPVLLFFVLFLGDAQNVFAADAVVDKNHASCVSCHRIPVSEISETNLFPEGIDPSSICLDCHHYSDNHHPVNFIPQSTFNNSEGEAFPLFEGEMRCLTCHRVHKDRGLAGRARLLRGGPYKERTEICFSCHDKDLNTKIDVHYMIDAQGVIKKYNGEPVCLMCHGEVPDQTVEPVEVTFKADVAFLCWRCHPPMPNDGFFKGHYMAKPKERTLEQMIKVQTEYGVRFPLQPRDRVTCSTCHNPHQKGVIMDGPAQAGADAPARLRMPNSCIGCHNM